MPDSTPSQTVGSSSSTQTYREPPPLDFDLYGCIKDYLDSDCVKTQPEALAHVRAFQSV
jgi:hypothetical protein